MAKSKKSTKSATKDSKISRRKKIVLISLAVIFGLFIFDQTVLVAVERSKMRAELDKLNIPAGWVLEREEFSGSRYCIGGLGCPQIDRTYKYEGTNSPSIAEIDWDLLTSNFNEISSFGSTINSSDCVFSDEETENSNCIKMVHENEYTLVLVGPSKRNPSFFKVSFELDNHIPGAPQL